MLPLTAAHLQAQLAGIRSKHSVLAWCLFALRCHKHILTFNMTAVCLLTGGQWHRSAVIYVSHKLKWILYKGSLLVITALIFKSSLHITHIHPLGTLAGRSYDVCGSPQQGTGMRRHFSIFSSTMTCELVTPTQTGAYLWQQEWQKKEKYPERCVAQQAPIPSCSVARCILWR